MEFNTLMQELSDEIIYAKDNFIPIIRDESALFLYNYVTDNNIKNVLEIGTAIGFSGSIILSAGAESLTTIEINERNYQIAIETFEKLNYKDKVTMYLADAKYIVP